MLDVVVIALLPVAIVGRARNFSSRAEPVREVERARRRVEST
jgi:hypothetical protein